MSQEPITFYTINNTCPAIPLKQKVYLFSQHDSGFHRALRNPERSRRKAKGDIDMAESAKMHNVWTPHLPSKKLFEEPKFFLSLQRKKIRIINGIKNMSILSDREPGEPTLRGKKLKEGPGSMRRISSSLEPADLFSQAGRRGWEPSNRTPYLNFNMQYLIKRRKSMTPTLYSPGLDKMSKTSSSQFH